jgi:hypothetical protein
MDKEGFEMGVASVKDSDIEQAAAMNDIMRRSTYKTLLASRPAMWRGNVSTKNSGRTLTIRKEPNSSERG